MDPERVALVLAVASVLRGVAGGASCPGAVQLASDETDSPLPVSFVPTGWGSPDGGAEFEVDSRGNVIPHMGSRAYFALECTPGEYDNRKYMGMNLLGRTLRYTVDLSGAGCGCNAAFYLTSMNLNEEKSECGDHYCDANNVCGESCAEIDIQEANKYAWHSTLHTESDPSGVGGGYGGGGKDWNGPRDWTGIQYSPGGECIDTSEPFQVAASFPVNATGWLTGMVVVLSQASHSCTLKTSITSYEGMEELSRAIRAGMTPIVSYWSDDDMLWMDGLGKDKKGPCKTDSAADCSETVKFFNLSVGDLDREALAAEPAAPAAGPDREDSTGAFCCLSSRDEDDFCGSCPAYARADPSGHCGGSESSCAACGGKATWCTQTAASVQKQLPSLPAPTPAAEAADSPAPTAAPTPLATPSAVPAPAPAPRAASDGFCCLASSGTGADFCGQCFPGGRALPGSRCGSSRSDCQFCGGQAAWCEEPAEQPATKKADSPRAAGEETAEQPAADSGDGHCCLAATDSDDFCGSCFSNAIANSSSKCGASRAACESCGGGSRWCGPQLKGGGAATLVLRGLEGPAEDAAEAEPFDCKAGLAKWERGWSDTKKSWCCEVKGSPCPETTTAAAEDDDVVVVETTTAAAETTSSAPDLAPRASNGTGPAAAGFCCLAAGESGGRFCGTCFPNARAQGGSHCGKSRDACEKCGGAATWCDALSGSDVLGGAGGTGAASKTSTSGAPKPSTNGAAPRSSTTSAAPKSSTTSAAPEPICPGMVEIQSNGLSDLPAQIVPTGWGSTYGPVPVQVANYSTISANLGARAYFAMSCTAGRYSNQDYMAFNLLGRSLRYTVDLSGAGCGCNAALYLTSMRQNQNLSSCSDYYCDANSVCGVACAEIDIQEANMHSWHSTLHGRDDPDGVGGGFGGGGEEWSGPRDWSASQYSPGGSCIDTRRPFDVDAAFPVDAEGSLAGMVVTLSQEGKSCPLSTLTVGYAGMPELTEALKAGMTPIVSYWNADDMLWMDGKGKDKLGACKKDRPDRCAESVRFSNFSVGVAPTLPPTAAPTPVPTAEPTAEPTAAPTGAPTAEPTAAPTAAPTPAPTRPAGFCCLAAPNPFDYCGSCPGFAKAPEGSGCAKSEDSCNQCGGISRWCATEDSTTPEPRHVTHSSTSHAPRSSKQASHMFDCDAGLPNWEKGWSDQKKDWCCAQEQKGCEATVRLGAKEVVAEVVGKPSGGGSDPELQGKFGGGALLEAAGKLRPREPLPDLATLLCLPGLVFAAFASLAWLHRRRRAAAESDADPPLSARPMVRAEDSELDLA